ncbi:OLC1v1032403C1 [Oldenlandia corymbosa var. corymbosa]|uniref:OLC1v1032403C1 n=1 Tax=Oldenlandia corymbosa var. corymbosa TaxID=529605 RepID=A0AAV1CKX8_OLDCO|nr:OLC1v1032403C1 [Oldenlandia corymbosa var. corymbosa]
MALLTVPFLSPSPALSFSASGFSSPYSHPFPGILLFTSKRIRRPIAKNNVAPIMASADAAQSDRPTKLVTFLGKGGSGKTTSAIFAAQHYAMEGLNTCLVIHSQDPTADFLLNCKIGTSPTKCNNHLSAVKLETTKMLIEPLRRIKEADDRLQLTQGALEVVVAEELGVLPGMDSIFSVLALGRLLGFLRNDSQQNSQQEKFDIIVLDGMSSEEIVRMIGATSKSRLYLKYLRRLAEKTDMGRLAGPSLLRLLDEAMGFSNPGAILNGSSQIWDQLEQILERGSSFFNALQSFACYLVVDSNRHLSLASALRYWGCAIQAGAQVSGALTFGTQNTKIELADVAKNFSPLPFACMPHLSLSSYPDWNGVLMDAQSQDARRILRLTGHDSSISPPVNFNPSNKSITLLMPGFDKSEIKLYQFRGGSELLVEAGDQRRIIHLPSQIRGKVGGAKFIDRSLVITMR